MSTPFDTTSGTPVRRANRVNDWTLERLALGELPADEARAVEARLAIESGGLGRLAALERDTVAILKEYPAELIVPRIERRLREADRGLGAFAQGWWSGMLVGGGAAVVAAVLTFAALTGQRPLADRGLDPALPADVTRIKGLEPHIVVHRAVTGQAAERLGPDATAAPGDVLQIGYVAAGEPYGVLLSVDGAGAVTLHHPEFASLPPRVRGEGRVDLPFAYTLDAAPEFERFLLVTSARPIVVQDVLDAAHDLAARPDARTAPLALASGLAQRSLVLRKAAR